MKQASNSPKVVGLFVLLTAFLPVTSIFAELEEDLLDRVKGAVVYVHHERGAGSGFLVSQDGYLWTNGHVIRKPTSKNPQKFAERIVVVLDNGEKYAAKVIGHELQPDCALLKIEVKRPLPFLKLADSSTLREGQKVFAIGQPNMLKKTVTKGILSNVRRRMGFAIVPLLQLDADLNPGNSGGPLLNEQGDVIGINTYGLGGPGLNGAFPTSALKTLDPIFRQHGRFCKSTLPFVLFVALQKKTLEALKIPSGVLVSQVLAGSSVGKNGIKIGDIIIEVDGLAVKSTDDPEADLLELNWYLMTRPVGSKVALKLVRGANVNEKYTTVDIQATTEESPLGFAELPEQMIAELGLGFKPWTQWLAFNYRSVPAGCVAVSTVVPGEVMSKAGMIQGDFIAEIGGIKVRSPGEVEQEFDCHLAEQKKWIHFTVYRDEVPLKLILAPEYSLKGMTVALVCPPVKMDAESYERVSRHLARLGAQIDVIGVTNQSFKVKNGRTVVPVALLDGLDVSRYNGFIFLDIADGEQILDYKKCGNIIKTIVDSKKPLGAIGAAPAAFLKAVPDLAKRKMTFRSDWLSKVSDLNPSYTGQVVEGDGSLITTSGESDDSIDQFLVSFDRALKTQSPKS